MYVGAAPSLVARDETKLTWVVQVNRWVNFSALKHYFNVSNSYVVNKLFLVLFPFRHKPWSRKQAMGPNGHEGYLPPRDDINSPDMYIPGKPPKFQRRDSPPLPPPIAMR